MKSANAWRAILMVSLVLGAGLLPGCARGPDAENLPRQQARNDMEMFTTTANAFLAARPEPASAGWVDYWDKFHRGPLNEMFAASARLRDALRAWQKAGPDGGNAAYAESMLDELLADADDLARIAVAEPAGFASQRALVKQLALHHQLLASALGAKFTLAVSPAWGVVPDGFDGYVDAADPVKPAMPAAPVPPVAPAPPAVPRPPVAAARTDTRADPSFDGLAVAH